MENILISACLLGIPTRYDGKSVEYPKIRELSKKYNLIPFCPEIYGGLPTPRIPSERKGDKVFTRFGDDVTENYERGAVAACKICELFSCKTAILKERSPACASHEIYDGSFSGRKIKGMGLAAQRLSNMGVQVISEEEIDDFLTKII